MKLCLFSLALFASASVAQAQHFQQGITGSYDGTCIGNYAGQSANPCAQNLWVDQSGLVQSSGCISQTAFAGYLQGYGAQLRAGGWAGQPSGQTLDLSFRLDRGTWTAYGSGAGIADRKWTYQCSFSRRWDW